MTADPPSQTQLPTQPVTAGQQSQKHLDALVIVLAALAVLTIVRSIKLSPLPKSEGDTKWLFIANRPITLWAPDIVGASVFNLADPRDARAPVK